MTVTSHTRHRARRRALLPFTPRLFRATRWLTAVLLIALLPWPSGAATFLVNATNDQRDAMPGDGVCATAQGTCTLRAAIEEANALDGADEITLPAGQYNLDLHGAGEDAAASGDLDITADLTITGGGRDGTIIDGGSSDRVCDILAPANVTLSGLTIQRGNAAAVGGGGVRNAGALTLLDVALQTNTAAGGAGGGMANTAAGTAQLITVTVSGNSARSGAGIANAGILQVSGTTISTNNAAGGDAQHPAVGGGLANIGTAMAQVSNVTISGNSAAIVGGGIANLDAGIVQLNNVTIADNHAGNGSGIDNFGAAQTALQNTIIADNPPFNCTGHAITSLGHNLATDTSCVLTATGDRSNIAAGLDQLRLSGATAVHALLNGSPAIDAGDNTTCAASDQRGRPRPADGNGDGMAVCDVGAYELQPSGTPAAATATPSRTPTRAPTTAAATIATPATATATSSPTTTRTASPMPTITPSPTIPAPPTAMATATSSQMATLAPTITATPDSTTTATSSPTTTRTASPIPTATPSPTAPPPTTAAATATRTATLDGTAAAITATPSPTTTIIGTAVQDTATPSPILTTAAATTTFSPTATATDTATPRDTDTATPTSSATVTASATASATMPMPTATPTVVNVVVGTARGEPGQHVSFEVRLMAPAGAIVSAVNNDIGFDPFNTPIERLANGAPNCTINPDLGKVPVFVFRPPGCKVAPPMPDPTPVCTAVRAAVLSLVPPISQIPNDVALYSCTIAIAPGAAPGEYSLSIGTLVVGDLQGTPVPAVGVSGSVLVSPVATATATPTSSATATITATDTPTPSPTATPTSTPTLTPSPSLTATASFTSTATPTRTQTPTPSGTPSRTPTLTPRPCGGDCNRNGAVTVDEIVSLVNLALGISGVPACPPGDVDGDGQITVDEIVAAVNHALDGCV